MPSLCGELIHGRWLPDPAVISIHPPRVGWDASTTKVSTYRSNFNSPTPCGVGLPAGIIWPTWSRFQSTHPVWGGTRTGKRSRTRRSISTHPPRVGWDQKRGAGKISLRNFNPPTPCGVGRYHPQLGPWRQNFNPPTPCGVGLPGRLPGLNEYIFQSTHPVWGGTLGRPGGQHRHPISIHPPRVGWDDCPSACGLRVNDFNPPTPCGVGHWTHDRWSYHYDFNPPTPCGVGQRSDEEQSRRRQFQSTHPVWGGTGNNRGAISDGKDFNPPTPCGVGPPLFRHCPGNSGISIHPPRVGWDRHSTRPQ